VRPENNSIPISSLVHPVRDWYSGVAIKMGGRQGGPSRTGSKSEHICFIVGREAFTSDAELTKTLLHERAGVVTSESAASVSGEVAPSATGGKVLIGFLIGAAVVGGVAAIVVNAPISSAIAGPVT
jgi:hypothetical protein